MASEAGITADELADALCHLIKDRTTARKMGLEGRKRVEARYSLKKEVEEFLMTAKEEYTQALKDFNATL